MITHNTEEIIYIIFCLFSLLHIGKQYLARIRINAIIYQLLNNPWHGQTEQRLNARSYERSPASALWSAFTHTGKRI